MSTLKADLRDDKIWVEFPYHPQYVADIKMIPGFRFVGIDKGGPAWRCSLDFETCVSLRRVFGEEITFSKVLTKWGREVGNQKNLLMELHETEDIELPVLAERLPALYETLRPYQKVGAAFVAQQGSNPLIADEPGLGKTRTTIAGLFEAGIPDTGPILVVAPLTALETVWLKELQAVQDIPVFVPFGGRKEREYALEDMMVMTEAELPFWLVVNPGMIQYKRMGEDPATGEEVIQPQFPQIHEIHWKAVVADEVHKAAMSNTTSMTAKAFYDLRCDKRVAITGTPMGGKPIKLYGILHWLHPTTFKSKWKFADQWLYVEQTRFGRKVGKVLPHKQEAFDLMLRPYMLRRTKREVAPELKEPLYQVVFLDMLPEQQKQYKQMELEAEVAIEERYGGAPDGSDQITAQGILAEYTRLKQFANAFSTLGPTQPNGRRKVIPTHKSNKLERLLFDLDEMGINKEDYDDPKGQKVVVFSQFTEFVKAMHEWLTIKEIHSTLLTGDTPGPKRLGIVDDFQKDGGSRVLLMNVMAGGVAITLDRADTVIFTDETWNPDDKTQGLNRVHRISRIHDVRVIQYYSNATIEQYIQSVNEDKEGVNLRILDTWRASYLKAAGIEPEE